MRKRRYLFTGMAVVLLFTILFAAGYTTPALGNVNTVQAAAKKKDISREGKKKRSIIKGKIFELEVDKPESVKDKNLTWSIKDSSIETFFTTILKLIFLSVFVFRQVIFVVPAFSALNLISSSCLSFPANVTMEESSKNKTIQAKGSLKRSIRVNGELELEVKKTKGKGVKDRQLKWTVEDSSVLAFEDMDDGIYDDEIEFVGIKPGKTTVTCTNTANKEKVTFTITVK